ncbi:MAG: transposase, partial [Chlamydiales bacterium]|nr:transposase [Chlamydiales bacterium]
IFLDDHDRRKFLETLGEACKKAEWQIHAYCLMNNHLHLVMETPKPTLVDGMRWMLSTYTQRFNARHQQRGHLFAGRYKSLIVDESDHSYLRTVCDYVHLNPVRAHLLEEGMSLERYQWSSFGDYLQMPHKRAFWLRVDRLLGEHGIIEDNASGRKEFSELMERRCAEEKNGSTVSYQSIRQGWKFGTQAFMERLYEKIASFPKRESHWAVEVNETMEAKGHRLLKEKLEELKLKPDDLVSLPCKAPIKIEIAQLLRSQTTLPLKWIARELKAGEAETLAVALRKNKNIKNSAMAPKCGNTGTDPYPL